MRSLFFTLCAFVLFSSVVFALGCQSTARKAVYSAWETVGVEKRDLLKDKIEDVRDDQKEAGKTFKDALERLQETYSVEPSQLSRQYDKLQSSYDDAVEDAGDVHKSIEKMDTIAGDLFKEWESEIGEIKTAELKTKSRERLRETQSKYRELYKSVNSSEAQMQPILAKFKDQVLYLKHNLNAQSIGSLKAESARIEKDIQQLIERMNSSIKSADAFIAEIDQS